MSRIILFGAHGQLGGDFLDHSVSERWDVVCAPRELRLENNEAVAAFVRKHEPQWIFNAAAMTDVDAAHLHPDRALNVNGLAPGVLASSAHDVGARVIHISSEAVYRGSKKEPYVEGEACQPVSVYGASKLTGDLLTMTYHQDSFVLRTSWLYSKQPGSNFPTRILDQLSEPTKKVSVVTDIVGNPTPTTLLIDASASLLDNPPAPGVYHVCAGGSASKFDWAIEIAVSYGHDPTRIVEVTSDEYETIAKRPKHVDLDCSKFEATGLLELPHWREAWVASRTG